MGTVGSIIINMYKLLIAAAVIAVASCEAEAEADPGYLYGAYPALYNAYPNWPGVSAPGVSSTCYGCRPYHYYGKRSADAEADPGYLYAPYHYGAYGYRYGLAGIAGHPGAATSFVARSPQGLRGKRSAEPWGYGYPYGFYGHPYAYGPGIAGHPGAATSYVARSPQGLGK